ncbi:hypothetical protein [Ancylobacter sp.]|uniref:hypothetical protein n=1 Tax=Ancylobacter sp. TaxID=1872567 RepID=UPI003BACE041
MSGRRNSSGFNDTADCFRTINGERYVGWMINPSAARISAYRAAGIKCRKVRRDELFVRESDTSAASDIDRKADRA